MSTFGSSASVQIQGRAALEAGAGDGGHRRALTLIVAATLACIAAIFVAALPVLSGPGTPLASRDAMLSHAATSVPMALAETGQAGAGASDHSFWPVRRGASLMTQGGGIHSAFTGSGASLRVAQGALGLSLAAVGRGAHVARVASLAPIQASNQVLYRYGSITEFFKNGPDGLEQGFTLLERPHAGSGSLVLAVSARGSLIPRQVGSEIVFGARSRPPALRYGHLSAFDATGRRLPARMQVHNGTLRLVVDDTHARYPLRIDPLVQQARLAVPSGPKDEHTVAITPDGQTALVGEPTADRARVFIRNATGGWEQQGPALEPTVHDNGPGKCACFGHSIALSADGSTALIGAPGDTLGETPTEFEDEIGSAFVFVRVGGGWHEQARLRRENETDGGEFGSAVSLSADGSTALIGAPLARNNEEGAVFTFNRSGVTWSQRAQILTPTLNYVEEQESFALFGWSVAVSADGRTALVGEPGGGPRVEPFCYKSIAGANGKVVPYSRGEGQDDWSTQGGAIAFPNTGWLGVNVSMSADGRTAVSGAPCGGDGSFVVMHQSNDAWTATNTAPVTKEKMIGLGGVATISPDGRVIFVGGAGLNNQILEVNPATPSVAIADRLQLRFGAEVLQPNEMVAVTDDGGYALLAENAEERGGAISRFVEGFVNKSMEITELSPPAGPLSGGTRILINGERFTGIQSVRFAGNGVPVAVPFTVDSSHQITVTSPASPEAQKVEVEVVGTNGFARRTFTYTTALPPAVEITAPGDGRAFAQGAVVATQFSCRAGASGGVLSSCQDSNGVTQPAEGALTTKKVGHYTYTVTALDTDGQRGAATIGYDVVSAPQVAITTPATGGVYAVEQEVPTAFACTEAPGGPGIERCFDSADRAFEGEGFLLTERLGKFNYTVTAVSFDGARRSTSISYKVAAAPTAQIISPRLSSRRVFPLGETVPTNFKCKEGAFGSGLASCIPSSGGPVTPGQLYTGEEGVYEYRVLATSNDGQTGEAVPVPYRVVGECEEIASKGSVPLGGGRTITDRVNTETDTSPMIAIRGAGSEEIRLQGLSNASCTATLAARTLSGEGPARVGRTSGYRLQYTFEVTGEDSFVTLSLRDHGNGVVFATNHAKLGKGVEPVI